MVSGVGSAEAGRAIGPMAKVATSARLAETTRLSAVGTDRAGGGHAAARRVGGGRQRDARTCLGHHRHEPLYARVADDAAGRSRRHRGPVSAWVACSQKAKIEGNGKEERRVSRLKIKGGPAGNRTRMLG